ncbi:hypothetical protein RJ641_005093 [Dillenia turbinata]|uniref:R13L1/DRL21-like LRR repeat region domain-containing protein n=1 Tax=Dillenia turbinata TaxID=194707 RepID=A0AAN8VJN9_9MAGN
MTAAKCHFFCSVAQIKKITKRLEDIEEEKTDLDLEVKRGTGPSIINKRLKTTSLLDSSEIVGREQDVAAILKLMGLSETPEAEPHILLIFVIFILLRCRNYKSCHAIRYFEGAKKAASFDTQPYDFKLEWINNLNNTENIERQTKVPNLLQPHTMLRNLVIKGYGGVTLPKWIGDSSYSKLVGLSLINCRRCKSLPALGGLSVLNKLVIDGMLEIETIGTELYGETSPQPHGRPFPSLKMLMFQNMPKWVHWSIPVDIPSLLHLEIRDCPELVVPVLSMLSSLRELWIIVLELSSIKLDTCPSKHNELSSRQSPLPSALAAVTSKMFASFGLLVHASSQGLSLQEGSKAAQLS